MYDDVAANQSALIADDDEYFRMALTRILSDRLGFDEIIETGSFDEAIERLEGSGGVKLALFDLYMPGIDSPAALRVIRDSFEVDKLAVVSGSRRRSDVLMSLEAGAHGFISKGQGARDLETALRQILEGTVYVPPTLAELEPRDEAAAGSEGMRGQAPRSSAAPEALPRLTPRQRDVLELLVKGKSNKEIARALELGPGTIKVHLAALFRNLGVENRSAAAVAGSRLLERICAEPGSESDTSKRASG